MSRNKGFVDKNPMIFSQRKGSGTCVMSGSPRDAALQLDCLTHNPAITPQGTQCNNSNESSPDAEQIGIARELQGHKIG